MISAPIFSATPIAEMDAASTGRAVVAVFLVLGVVSFGVAFVAAPIIFFVAIMTIGLLLLLGHFEDFWDFFGIWERAMWEVPTLLWHVKFCVLDTREGTSIYNGTEQAGTKGK